MLCMHIESASYSKVTSIPSKMHFNFATLSHALHARAGYRQTSARQMHSAWPEESCWDCSSKTTSGFPACGVWRVWWGNTTWNRSDQRVNCTTCDTGKMCDIHQECSSPMTTWDWQQGGQCYSMQTPTQLQFTALSNQRWELAFVLLMRLQQMKLCHQSVHLWPCY